MIPIWKFTGSGIGMYLALAAIMLRKVDIAGFVLIRAGLFVTALYLYCTLTVAAHITCNFWTISLQFQKRLCLEITGPATWESFQYPKTRKHARQVLKTLRPLKISVGRLYSMEKAAKLTFSGFLVYGTARLIITFS